MIWVFVVEVKESVIIYGQELNLSADYFRMGRKCSIFWVLVLGWLKEAAGGFVVIGEWFGG